MAGLADHEHAMPEQPPEEDQQHGGHTPSCGNIPSNDSAEKCR